MFDLETAVAAQESSDGFSYPDHFDLSTAMPIGAEASKPPKPNYLSNFVGSLARFATDPLMLKTGAPQEVVGKFYEGGTRTAQGVGTATQEVVERLGGKTTDFRNLSESFLAGFAPELYPDYPKDKITTIGAMFKGYAENLSEKYGDTYEDIYASNLPKTTKNILAGMQVLSSTAGESALDLIGLVGDFYANPAQYLTLTAINRGALATAEQIPLFKTDLLKTLQGKFKLPETIDLQSTSGAEFQNSIKGVLDGDK